jgi:hypothetical protein
LTYYVDEWWSECCKLVESYVYMLTLPVESYCRQLCVYVSVSKSANLCKLFRLITAYDLGCIRREDLYRSSACALVGEIICVWRQGWEFRISWTY